MIYFVIQYVVLTAAILFSAWHLLNRIMPKRMRVLQARLSGRAPSEAPKGCGTGCDTCRMCETVAALSRQVRKD